MARTMRWETLTAALTARGLDLATEQGRTIAAWLWLELDHGPPDHWETVLPDSADRAVQVYQGFMAAFDHCYMKEEGTGERWVRESVRNRFGFAPEPVVEEVLDRIRNRRFHLLRRFRASYQARMFGEQTFDPTRVRGYMRHVAWVESRKAPMQRMRLVVATTAEQLDGWLLPWHEEIGEADGHLSRARLLATFWNQQCFSPSMRLEGMVSIGLGFLTGVALLEERSRRFLEARLPAWEARQDEHTDRLRRLLDRQGALEARLCIAWGLEDRAALEKELQGVRDRLAILRDRILRHRDRLLPRPQAVQELLAGIVDVRCGTLRFARIGREIDLLHQRVERGAAALSRGLEDPGRELVEAVEEHLSRRPPSPRQHGLTPDDRDQRRRQDATWREDALWLARRLEKALRSAYPRAEDGGALRDWLSDALDLYELGILDRVGVTGGLRRSGWRLERLLRPEL